MIVYLPDNEPFYRGHAEARTPHAATDTTAFIHAEEAKMVEFIRGADVLIGDAQYDAEEYQAHLGWGHGSVDDLVTLALRGQVKRLYLFHHDPEHDDAKVARMVEHARKLVAAQDGRLVVEGAREGEQFELTGPRG